MATCFKLVYQTTIAHVLSQGLPSSSEQLVMTQTLRVLITVVVLMLVHRLVVFFVSDLKLHARSAAA